MTTISNREQGMLAGAQQIAATADVIATRTEFLTGLYRLYLKRAPDTDGLNFYLAAMEQGETVDNIENGFASSPEHLNLLAAFKANPGTKATAWKTFSREVASVFQQFLGRDPTVSESDRYAWWFIDSEGGRPMYVQVVLAISTSAEARQRDAARPFDTRVAEYTALVQGLYTGSVGRPATEMELQRYVAALFQGTAWILIVEEIEATDEARSYWASQQPVPEQDYSVPASYFDEIQPLQLDLSSSGGDAGQGSVFTAIAQVVSDIITSVSNVFLAVKQNDFAVSNPDALAQVVSQYTAQIPAGTNAVVEIRAARPGAPISLAAPRWETFPLSNSYGMQFNPAGGDPVLYRLTFDPDSPQTVYSKTFSILAHGRVHEKLTAEAAKRAGIKGNKKFMQLIWGVQYPDIPEGELVGYFNLHRDGTTTFESHYGALQFWHSMTPSGGPYTNQQVQGFMVDQLGSWYSQAQQTGDYEYLGRILHTIQDSFSQSHTVRNPSGEIGMFQDYSRQDPDKHALADRGEWQDLPGTEAALKASTELLIRFENGATLPQIQEYLRSVFRLQPGTEQVIAGGVGT